MGQAVEFVLLGPVGAWVGGQPVDIGHQRQRAVLAALLANVGRPVPVESLIERVWGPESPDGARRTLQSYITRIRALLTGLAVGRLQRQSGGYLLDTDPNLVDANRFQALVTKAAGLPPTERAAALRAALDLWRGEPFGGVSGDWATRMRTVWVQHRIDTAVAWADAEARAGDGAAPVATLLALAGEYPLVEPLAAALVRALAAAGRTDEALDRYHAVRRRLADELGADPGPELQQAHRTALQGTLQGTAEPVVERPPAADVPAQLPADVPAFTGRQAELAALDAGAAGSHEGATVVLCVVSGAAGVGKTALAVRWAHRAARRFPDGQLYLNLRGHDIDRPVTPAEALGRLLSALGVPGHEIPPDADDRAARLRTALAGRRVLLVLDNASSAEQVRPLLPGGGSCAVVVTSRDSLAGLVATQGAHRVDLGPLRHDEAFALLRRLIGEPVDQQPETAATLVAQCGRLPLALRIAAELARSRPGSPLSRLVGELADERRRPGLLAAGADARAAVGAVYSWSVRHLPPPAARTFRLLGVHPGADFDVFAAAALAGTDRESARRDLDILAAAHLLERRGPGRFGLHDLLRSYAAGLATADETGAATDRLLDYLLAVSAAAVDVLHPGEARRRTGVPTPRTPVPVLATADDARAWLNAERAVLVEAAGHAVRVGRPAFTTALSPVLLRYLAGGHYVEAMEIHTQARTGAREIGDEAAEAQALLGLAGTHRLSARYDAAVDLLREALVLFDRAGDLIGQARASGDLGSTELFIGRHPEALGHLQRARDLFEAAGDRFGAARALAGIGVVFQQQNRRVEAAEAFERSLEESLAENDEDSAAQVLVNLGELSRHLADYDTAVRHYEHARRLFRRLGARTGEAYALDGLGGTHLGRKRYDLAAACFEEALAMCRDMGDRHLEAWSLNGLGEVSGEIDRPADAIGHHDAAATVAGETGQVGQLARAYAGLGDAYLALDDIDRARRYLRMAVDGYASLDPPRASALRDRLAALG
jgi:DNA-binding SARP family transcriptional activator